MAVKYLLNIISQNMRVIYDVHLQVFLTHPRAWALGGQVLLALGRCAAVRLPPDMRAFTQPR